MTSVISAILPHAGPLRSSGAIGRCSTRFSSDTLSSPRLNPSQRRIVFRNKAHPLRLAEQCFTPSLYIEQGLCHRELVISRRHGPCTRREAPYEANMAAANRNPLRVFHAIFPIGHLVISLLFIVCGAPRPRR